MNALERLVVQEWKGGAWALFTICSGCGRMSYCHGKSRERVLCLQCFDQKGSR